jgi:hypothetical protein
MATRILYFGSREWIDVPRGWRSDEVHAENRYGRSPWFGPRHQAIQAQMRADVAEHGTILVIEGEANGADVLARAVAYSLKQVVMPYPVDTKIDGPWPAAGHRRNARMHREGKPVAARGFIVGERGTPLSRGSAGMLDILRRAGVPTIVHRDDGIE